MPEVEQRRAGQFRLTRVALVERLQQFLLRHSNGARLGYGLAIAGHLIITVLLILGAFERIEPASAVVTIPVEIVLEKPNAQPQSSPDSAPSEQNPPPSLPAVTDTDKRAKAPFAARDINGNDQPKQPGHDGGEPRQDPAGTPSPPADGESASGSAAAPSQAMNPAPIGPAQPQTTASEPGEDELTAIKEEKLECGRKAKVPSRTEAVRSRGRVLGFITEAQGLAQTRSSQVALDRHIDPHYLRSQQVLVQALDGAGRGNVVLPAGFTVGDGDVIDIDLGYVSPSDPCHYIPNVAVAKR